MKKMMKAGIAVIFAISSTVLAGAANAGDAEAGKGKSAACGGCHGFDGNSPIATYPKLAGQNEAYIVKQVKDFKANTTRQNAIMLGMVAALSDEDAADIGAYFQAQSVNAAADHDASKLATGREIYKGGDLPTGMPACQGCHGPKGDGTAGIGFPQLGGQHVDYTLAQLKAFKDGTRTNDDKSLMRDIVKNMSESDMIAVSHYIASLK